MALDTRDRRASAVHVGLPWRGLLPLPDALAEDQGDRQHVGGYYRGVLAEIPGFGSIPLLEFGPIAYTVAGASPTTAVLAGGGSVAVLVASGSDANAEAEVASGAGLTIALAKGSAATREN